MHVAHAHARRPERWADEPTAIIEMQRKAPVLMAACFDLIENAMFVGPWVMGSAYTVADPYLFTITQWLPAHRVNVARYPKIREHLNRMLRRPAVVAALEAEAA